MGTKVILSPSSVKSLVNDYASTAYGTEDGSVATKLTSFSNDGSSRNPNDLLVSSNIIRECHVIESFDGIVIR